MKKVIDYKVLDFKLLVQLEGNVKEHLKQGWHLQGGISVWGFHELKGSTYSGYAQAMVKYEE